MKSGIFDSLDPILTVDASWNGSYARQSDTVTIHRSVSDSDSNASIALFLVINQDYLQLSRIRSTRLLGSSFEVNRSLSSLHGGLHHCEFHAVRDSGYVSLVQFVSVTVVPDLSQSPSPSPTPFDVLPLSKSSRRMVDQMFIQQAGDDIMRE
jgi:hypothetical protein